MRREAMTIARAVLQGLFVSIIAPVMVWADIVGFLKPLSVSDLLSWVGAEGFLHLALMFVVYITAMNLLIGFLWRTVERMVNRSKTKD
jgi:uncharacterized membrane protein